MLCQNQRTKFSKCGASWIYKDTWNIKENMQFALMWLTIWKILPITNNAIIVRRRCKENIAHILPRKKILWLVNPMILKLPSDSFLISKVCRYVKYRYYIISNSTKICECIKLKIIQSVHFIKWFHKIFVFHDRKLFLKPHHKGI